MKILAIILFLTMYILMTVFMNRRIWIVLATALIFIVSGILPPASILSAINWRLRISGDGTIYVLPYSADPAAVFDPIGNDLIEPKIKVSQDWYNCPNVYMAVAGDVTGIARDEDPESMFSVANRGREVWKRETGCALAANETVAEYALRKLKEAQHAKQKASYSRRFVPDVYPEDCVSMRYHAQGLDGIYTVSSQSITLGYGARTSEQIYKE